MISFYQIATKIDVVYEVNLPAQIKQLLSYFTLGISFGLGSMTDVLTCLGFSGFLRRLLFWMVLPMVLVMFIFVGSVVRVMIKDRKITRGSLLETAFPNMLRILFLLYPIVTNEAFEAFSCYEFDRSFPNVTTTAYLVSDVEIECTWPWGGDKIGGFNDEHTIVTVVAFVAVAMYPIGLIVIYGILLGSARKAIQSTRHVESPLSRATMFLHTEYEPLYFWWELMEVRHRLPELTTFSSLPPAL